MQHTEENIHHNGKKKQKQQTNKSMMKIKH